MSDSKGIIKSLNFNTKPVSEEEFVRFEGVREGDSRTQNTSEDKQNQTVTNPLLQVREFVRESVKGKRKRSRDSYPIVVWRSSV